MNGNFATDKVMAMISLPFLPLKRIHCGRKPGQKYTSFSDAGLDLFQSNHKVETAILFEILFSKANHGG